MTRHHYIEREIHLCTVTDPTSELLPAKSCTVPYLTALKRGRLARCLNRLRCLSASCLAFNRCFSLGVAMLHPQAAHFALGPAPNNE